MKRRKKKKDTKHPVHNVDTQNDSDEDEYQYDDYGDSFYVQVVTMYRWLQCAGGYKASRKVDTQNDDWNVDLKINDKEITFKIDSGT